jgi:hypothetical protein
LAASTVDAGVHSDKVFYSASSTADNAYQGTNPDNKYQTKTNDGLPWVQPNAASAYAGPPNGLMM